MHIVLGSTSQIKTTAVETACHALGLTAAVTLVAVASRVNAQPIGRAETEQGALNRARGAHARAPGAYAIGIENGLRETADGWEDWAVIAMVYPNGTEVLVDSAAITFPTDAVEEARARGFATTTAGQVIAEHTGCNPNDPHSFLTHGSLSRLELLTKAVHAALTIALTTH